MNTVKNYHNGHGMGDISRAGTGSHEEVAVLAAGAATGKAAAKEAAVIALSTRFPSTATGERLLISVWAPAAAAAPEVRFRPEAGATRANRTIAVAMKMRDGPIAVAAAAAAEVEARREVVAAAAGKITAAAADS